MVRRLLLTALVAVLAVALPASAQEDPPASEPSSDPPADCPPLDPFCASPALPIVWGQCDVWQLECNLEQAPSVEETRESTSCRAFEYNSISQNQPVWETLVVDPDGCLKAWAKRTLGIPPVEAAVEDAHPLSSLVQPLL